MKEPETRPAHDLRDHDLITLDGEDYMVDWTVGLRNEGKMRLGLIRDRGARSSSSFWRDVPYNKRVEYRGRA